MASLGHDALWAKLYELDLQLAAYKILRAARGEEDVLAGAMFEREDGAGGTCRGSKYDAYMRRRDARRIAAAAASSSAEPQAKGQGHQPPPRGTRAGGGRPRPLTPKCAAARDTQEVKRTPAVSVPTTPINENGALTRSRTVSTGGAAAGGTPARSHRRRNSAGVPTDFGDSTTPRPFLRRGSGTGGAAVAPLRTPRVNDLPLRDVASSSPRQPPQGHSTQVARRHSRSVSELPFRKTVAMDSPRSVAELLPPHAPARRRWGSPERPPPAMFSAASDSHKDFAKGLRQLLSFVRKSSKSAEHQHCPARSVGGRERDSGGKPVKAWAAEAACSLLDGPFDRASLEGHQFPMTQAVGISG